jgi:hypothetical protein
MEFGLMLLQIFHYILFIERSPLPSLEMSVYGGICHSLVPKHLFYTEQCQVPPNFSFLTSDTSDETEHHQFHCSIPIDFTVSTTYHEYGNIIFFFSDFKMFSVWNIFNHRIILSIDGTWYSKGL